MSETAKAQEIETAVEWLKSGRTVAMPTETVYGLAASIESPAGIANIFKLKQRPSFDPLIVHIHSLDQVKELASHWPDSARILAQKFWPGPLTIVVPKKPNVNNMITSGLETVGIRMPRHPIALALLKNAGVPLAAPSANIFGKISPTTSHHVRSEFPEPIKSNEIYVLEGGESDVGIESTVVRCEDDAITILRPGIITAKDITIAIANPQVKIQLANESGKHQSPGHTEHHYMPRQPLTVFWGTTEEILHHRKTASGFQEVQLPPEAALAARLLYASLREADQTKTDNGLILYRDVSKQIDADLWLAIDDRLKRAARHRLGQKTGQNTDQKTD